MKRRDFLKTCGAAAAGMALSPVLESKAANLESPSAAALEALPASLNDLKLPIRGLKPEINRQVSVIVIGAGNRGKTYSRYSKRFPDFVKVVGVADINEFRRNYLGDEYGIPQERRYGDYKEILSVPKFADACLVTTPDEVHYEPTMMALRLGYHVLVEKPIAPTEKECRDILDLSLKSGLVVGTCHVLRYAPYFIALREIVKRGYVGDLMSIQHQERVQFQHMAHSYVRGIWRNSKQSTPMILAKSCHDLDILRWIVDEPCKSIVADGDLSFFKAANAPEGAPLRCTDGCPHEKDCPYSALDIYTRYKRHNGVFDLKDCTNDIEGIMHNLRVGPYGRCVFHCDNDQPDHYVCNMVFGKDITASFSMDAFTHQGGRQTRIMGSRGYIEGSDDKFVLHDFLTGKAYKWDLAVDDVPEYKGSGHGGGDYALFRDFIEAVATGDPSHLSTTIDVSMESHLMGFQAEKSRRNGRKMPVKVK